MRERDRAVLYRGEQEKIGGIGEIEMKHLGDISRITKEDAVPVDCITFGSPCQDLSTAGKRAGLSGERSGLFMADLNF